MGRMNLTLLPVKVMFMLVAGGHSLKRDKSPGGMGW